MRVVVKMLCAAAVAMPLGTAAVPALAQYNLDPQLGTHCSRNGFERCAGSVPWFGGRHLHPQHRPIYRGPVQVLPRRHHYYRHDTSRSHEEWCYGTYRSYRAWDNTFKPYNGPRRECRSPYS